MDCADTLPECIWKGRGRGNVKLKLMSSILPAKFEKPVSNDATVENNRNEEPGSTDKETGKGKKKDEPEPSPSDPRETLLCPNTVLVECGDGINFELHFQCPYDATHKVMPWYFSKHINKCRPQYLSQLSEEDRKDPPVKVCRYKSYHLVLRENYEKHVLDCWNLNRSTIPVDFEDMVKQDVMILGNRFTYYF